MDRVDDNRARQVSEYELSESPQAGQLYRPRIVRPVTYRSATAVSPWRQKLAGLILTLNQFQHTAIRA